MTNKSFIMRIEKLNINSIIKNVSEEINNLNVYYLII